MESLDFSEDEIERQLTELGFTGLPKHRLREFKRDLDMLILEELSSDCTSSLGFKSCANEGSSAHDQRDDAASKTLAGSLTPDGQVPLCMCGVDTRTCPGKQKPCDLYTLYSEAAQYPWPSTVSYRQAAEGDFCTSDFAVSHNSKPPDSIRGDMASGKPVIKRKVVRKQRGGLPICDESAHGAGAVSNLEDQLERLQLSVSPYPDSDLGLAERESLSDFSSSHVSCLSTNSGFSPHHGSVQYRSQSESDILPPPKSFIQPQFKHPHTKNLKKTDLVAKYFQYKQEWENFRVPGEKDRKELRWEIREQMMYKPIPIPKPQRTYVPNSYIVPTEKKRSALRWEVRYYLANGLLPSKIT